MKAHIKLEDGQPILELTPETRGELTLLQILAPALGLSPPGIAGSTHWRVRTTKETTTP